MDAQTEYMNMTSMMTSLKSQIAQLEQLHENADRHRNEIVKDWFYKSHPELASRIIEHPNGSNNFISYPIGITPTNPYGTMISIRCLVGFEPEDKWPIIRDLPEFNINDYAIWADYCYPIGDLNDMNATGSIM